MTTTCQHEIRELLGSAAYEALCSALAGTALYIPKRLTPHSRLMMLAGRSAAERLSQACGGQTIELPTRRAHQNRQLVTRLLGEGWLPGDIARASGLSLRRVRQICAENRAGTAP
jgi:hypothetical protein